MRKIEGYVGGRTVHLRTAAFCLCLFALGSGSIYAQSAPDANSVLILGSSSKNAALSIEATQASAAGFNVVVASDSDWSAMTAADFASYRAIVFADGMCQGSSSLDAALANRSVWGSAVTGNIIAIGNHPGTNALFNTYSNGFVQSAIRFASGAKGTGAYANLGCHMSSEPTTVSILEPFGQFSVVHQDACSADSRVLATNPGVAGLSDANMAGWKCTSTADFVTWPQNFSPLVVAADIPGAYVDPSGNSVSPFIMVGTGQGTSSTTSTALQQSSAAISSSLALAPMSSGSDPTVDLSFPMSGNHDFFNEPLNLTDSSGDWGFKGGVRAYLDWNPQSKVTLQYDSNLVRQGESPGMLDTLDPGHGNMCMGIEANLDLIVDGHSVSLGGISKSVCGDCNLTTDGSHGCNLGKQYIDLYCIGISDVLEGCLDMTVSLSNTVGAQGFSTDRTLYYGGTAGTGPDVLTFPPNPQSDPFKVSCVQPEGTDVVYELANPRTSQSISNFKVVLGVAGRECDFITGCNPIIDVDLLTIPIPLNGFTLDLTGPTKQTDLGPVQKDITPPDLTAVATSYSGAEGTPIQFTAAGAKDSCIDYTSLVWNFSDTGIAYGFNPFHTFQDNGIYSGQLVATDLAGNRSTKSLMISTSNVAPVVEAGPDTTAPWGVKVAFNGSATDPGADDQSTLVYSWSFGDGSPSATGGPSVLHAYSAPGNYTATLTVCDKNGGCNSDTRAVAVRKRNVSLGYLGDQQGTYDTLTNLSGSLVDELGSVVPGRTIVFAIGAEAGGSAATNSSGIGSTTHLIGLPTGSYTSSATFAGDSLYNAASPSATAYTVNRKPTSVTYTGVLNGGPNKTVNLSAVLVDSQNKPLAGRVIAFKLGSQSASATTNASGVAAITLQLNQKNGSYPLTATFTPAAADANFYIGSVASATFKLQVK
jgi:PKD repeat protein